MLRSQAWMVICRMSERSSKKRFWKSRRRKVRSTQVEGSAGRRRKTTNVRSTARRTDVIVWRKKAKRRGISSGRGDLQEVVRKLEQLFWI